MTAFVEECRREWKRLGVPDLLAEEMASELEADLAEAEADGLSAAELLGESDPRRFAATWARERGLVTEPRPRSRKRIWIGLAAGAVLVVVALSTLALVRVGGGSAQPANVVKVPQFRGVKACDAVRIGHLAGLSMIHTVYKRRCNALVVSQKPAAGSYVPLHTPTTLRLSLLRIPHLVGLKVCDAKVVAARSGVWIRGRLPDVSGTRPLPKSSRCTNFVAAQKPAAGQIVKGPVWVTVTIRAVKS
jgi:hypothetical protein